MPVEMKSVDSTNVAAVGHDSETNTLHVRFKNGGTYQYHDVDAEKHQALLSASSIGSYVHNHIKGQHKHSKNG